MEGIGNDYVYFDGINQDVPTDETFIQKVSNRHIGIGSDGVCKTSSHFSSFL